MRNQKFKEVTVFGDDFDSSAAGTSGDIIIYFRDHNEDILFASGTDVPADTTSGYAKGCIFIDRDIATGTTGLYENIGTTTSSDFVQIGSDSPVGTLTPSHVTVYAGEVTWSGGGATLASTVTGVLATDIVLASFHTLGTEGTILQGAVASANTITFTLDAANTSNDAVISYSVLRAVS